MAIVCALNHYLDSNQLAEP